MNRMNYGKKPRPWMKHVTTQDKGKGGNAKSLKHCPKCGGCNNWNGPHCPRSSGHKLCLPHQGEDYADRTIAAAEMYGRLRW